MMLGTDVSSLSTTAANAAAQGLSIVVPLYNEATGLASLHERLVGLARTLRQRYGESLRFRAEENRGFVLEFFAHADGSWTLVMRRDDQACAIAAGSRWNEQPRDESAF